MARFAPDLGNLSDAEIRYLRSRWHPAGFCRSTRARMAEAMMKFGHNVSFEQARSQIGKGGDKLIPEFLSEDAQRDHGKELEEWRGKRFKSEYLPLVRPFSAVAGPATARPRCRAARRHRFVRQEGRTGQVSRDRTHRRPG